MRNIFYHYLLDMLNNMYAHYMSIHEDIIPSGSNEEKGLDKKI